MPQLARFGFAVLVTVTLCTPATAQSLDLVLYDDLLDRHTKVVDDLARTRVDYVAIGNDSNWKKLVASLAASKPSELVGESEKRAFWINAYNILAIDLVTDHYPLESIRDIGSFFSPVWKKPAGLIDGKRYSLDEIEHGIVRPMGDPRAHAAVICASTSCPALRREAFRAKTLDTQLDDAMRRWVADPGKGLSIDRARLQITLSKVFDWFAGDFDAVGGPIAFVASYAKEEDRMWLIENASRASIRYFDYDWRVNVVR
jgi:hypothetical protein